jgi:hypothetical protein
MKTLLACAAALAASTAVAGGPETWRFYGYAYDLESNKYL